MVVFEAETSGGEVRQVVSPTLPFPSSPPFHSPRSSEGEVPRLPPYKYHPVSDLHLMKKLLPVMKASHKDRNVDNVRTIGCVVMKF